MPIPQLCINKDKEAAWVNSVTNWCCVKYMCLVIYVLKQCDFVVLKYWNWKKQLSCSSTTYNLQGRPQRECEHRALNLQQLCGGARPSIADTDDSLGFYHVSEFYNKEWKDAVRMSPLLEKSLVRVTSRGGKCKRSEETGQTGLRWQRGGES